MIAKEYKCKNCSTITISTTTVGRCYKCGHIRLRILPDVAINIKQYSSPILAKPRLIRYSINNNNTIFSDEMIDDIIFGWTLGFWDDILCMP